MKKIEWIDGRTYTIESPKRFIELRQLRHPFCMELDNKAYMDSVRFSYTEFQGFDEKDINIDSEEEFIKSFHDLGLARILE